MARPADPPCYTFSRTPDDLYLMSAERVIMRARERLIIQPLAQLPTGTCFGRLPASYRQRLHEITQVETSAIIHGTAGRAPCPKSLFIDRDGKSGRSKQETAALSAVRVAR